MLNAMREGAKSGILRFIFFGLMGLATFGLVLTDAGGFFGGGFGRQTVATIGDLELTVPVFNNIYTREINRNNIPPDVARSYGIPQMTLGREINRLALLQAAYESDLRVGDSFVAQSIKDQLEQVGLTGDDQENLDYVLRQMNMSEGQLTQGTREDITAGVISVAPANTGKAMRAAVEALYRYEKEKRVAEIITVSPSDVTGIEAVSDEEALTYFQSNQAQFTSPETRTISMLHMTADAVGRDLVIGDDMIEAFYNANKSEYRQPDQYRFAQEVFETADESETALENVELDDMAADWFALNNLPSELSEALRGAQQGDVVGPVETSLGHHVVKVFDVKKDTYTPLAEVKDDIQTILRDEELDELIYNLADDLDNAVADGLSLSELAKQYDVPLKEVKNLQETGGANPNLPEKQNDMMEIVETSFASLQGEISPVVELSDGSFALIEVTSITERSVTEFETVKKDIKKILNTQRKQIAVQDKAAEILTAYTKGEKSLSNLARENDVSFSQTRAVLRNPQGGISLSTDEASLLFSLTPKNDISSLRVGNDVKIIRLADIKSASNVPEKGSDIDTLSQTVRDSMNNEMQQQFTNAWKEELGVKVNTELFQQVFLSSPDDDQ